MKNLKRLLSLVVVMALLCALPLTVSAAGADNYTDSGDITYTEAVDVLTGIGVLQGLTDGSYGPDHTMTPCRGRQDHRLPAAGRLRRKLVGGDRSL